MQQLYICQKNVTDSSMKLESGTVAMMHTCIHVDMML
jgi:hypothetical protein